MSDTEVIVPEVAANGAKRGRGRPKKDPSAPKPVKSWAKNGTTSLPKTATNGTNGEETKEVKKRGRKPVVDKPVVEPKTGPSPAKRGRGRPPKSASKKGKRGRKPGKKSAPIESAEEDSAPQDSNEDGEDGHEEHEEDED